MISQYLLPSYIIEFHSQSEWQAINGSSQLPHLSQIDPSIEQKIVYSSVAIILPFKHTEEMSTSGKCFLHYWLDVIEHVTGGLFY